MLPHRKLAKTTQKRLPEEGWGRSLKIAGGSEQLSLVKA
jgi:hypothetical protein